MPSAGSELSLENLKALKLTFGFIDAPLWRAISHLSAKRVHRRPWPLDQIFPAPGHFELLGHALIWTVGLVGTATIVSFALGTFLGIMAAWRRGTSVRHHRFRRRDLCELGAGGRRLADLAVLLRLHARLVPQRLCRRSDARSSFSLTYIGSVLYHGILPMLTLVHRATGGFAVTMRNNMINLLGEDYIVMGRAKGLSDSRVMLWYAARNALLPTVSASRHRPRRGARRLARDRSGLQLSGPRQYRSTRPSSPATIR